MPTNQDSGKKEPRPYAKVTSIRPVVRDGWYNAWTDLIWWKDYFWLAHFRGLAHGITRQTTGRIAGNSFSVILRSADLRRWHEAQVWEPPMGIVDRSGADHAHFCTDGDRLYAYFRVMTPRPPGGPDNHVYVSSTADGVRWSEPEKTTLEDGFPYVFRARWHEGTFYSATGDSGVEGAPFLLLTSEDGVHFKRHAQIAPFDPGPPFLGFSAESELHWRPDGELWCVIRTGGPAVLYCAKPPYVDWQETLAIDSKCDAPSICESDGQVYVAGRCRAPHNTFSHRESPFAHSGTTGLYRLRRDRADLLVMMPAGHDASYPGLVSLEPGKLVMSYYSEVAYGSGEVRPRYFPEFIYKQTDCDIYIAEIEVGEVS